MAADPEPVPAAQYGSLGAGSLTNDWNRAAPNADPDREAITGADHGP